MKFVGLLLSTTLVFAMQTAHADSQTQPYHPESPLALGKGTNRAFPLREFRRCIKRAEVVPLENSIGAVSAEVSTYRVTNSREFSEHAKVSVGVSARLKFLQGVELGVGGSIKQGVTFSQDTAVFIVKAHANYGRYEMADYELKPMYQKFLDRGSYENFMEMCGTDLVIRETREAMVMAIIEIKGLSETHKRTIGANATVGKSVGPAEIKLKPSFDQILAAKQKTKDVKVHFYARGGPGTAAVEHLATAETIDEFEEGLRKYMSQIKLENTVPATYKITSMEFVGAPPPPEFPDIEDEVAELYGKYSDLEDRIEMFQNHIQHNVGLMPDEYLGEVAAALSDSVEQMDQLHDYIVALLNFEDPEPWEPEELEEFQFQSFTPEIEVSSFDLVCQGEAFQQLACGSSFWTNFGWDEKKFTWNAILDIGLNVRRPQYLRKIKVVMKDATGTEKVLGTIELNQEQLGDMSEEFLNTNIAIGKRTLSFMSDTYHSEKYLNLRDSQSQYYLRVELVNGAEISTPIHRPDLVGKHKDLKFQGTF